MTRFLNRWVMSRKLHPTRSHPGAGEAPTVVEGAREAAKEVLAGDPGPRSRPWLLGVSMVSFAAFVVLTALVVTKATRGWFDIPVERAIQAVPWGPLVWLMRLINSAAGVWQVVLGLVVIVAMFLIDRRGGLLTLLGAGGSLLDQIVKRLVARPRPGALLVRVLAPVTGYSYPSGHAVFFTWMAIMLASSFAPRIPRAARPVLWAGAAFLIVMTCIARVWAGAHWPTDVLGGVALSLAWSSFVLWLPERWLPAPSRRWLPGLRRHAKSA